MEWPTALLVLGIIGLIAVVIFGGKFKAGKDGIEVDTQGLLHWLRLAREQKGTQAASASKPEGEASAPASKRITRIPAARIAWVDDQPVNNVFEKQALASVAIFSDSYTNNADAARAMSLVDYDMVISDIGRGGAPESGWDLIQQVKGVPLVYYTGGVDDALRQRAKTAGAVGITDSPDELMTIISASLGLPGFASAPDTPRS